MYVRDGDLSGFGDLGAWYDSITFDKQLLADWARRLDSSLPADNDALIARIARAPEQGGGFVVGNQRMCLSNTRGGRSEPLRAADVPCPPGSGGMIGEQIQEISAEEVRRQIEEQKRYEREERERAARDDRPRLVEVYGTVVDGSGSPIAGASVLVGSSAATTNGAGEFTVDKTSGTYAITIRAVGFRDRRVEGVYVGPGRPHNAGVIVLIRQAARGDGDRMEKSDEDSASTSWYKNKWLWISAGVVLVGGATAVVVVRRRRGR